eukprot:XP_024457182.1 uncharacterized protein LOC7464847 isoform X2 [Populus trichocarpa]
MSICTGHPIVDLTIKISQARINAEENNTLVLGYLLLKGDLGAFCSPECRDAQIAIDKAGQEVHGQSIGIRASSSRKDTTGKAVAEVPRLVYN